jgi:isoquinoline 1-oxidoreductase subunit alpha
MCSNVSKLLQLRQTLSAVAAFLKNHPDPTDADIDENLTNICRCGTYERLRRGVHRAAAQMRNRG